MTDNGALCRGSGRGSRRKASSCVFGLSSSLILAGVDVVIGDHPGVLTAVARDGESRVL